MWSRRTVDDRLGQAGLLRDIGEARLERTAGRLAAWLRPDAARRHALAERRTRRGDASSASSFPARHHSGSVAVERLPGFDILECLHDADGHRISTSVAAASAPSPTVSRLSLAER